MTRELLDEYLDGAVDAAGQAQIEKLLATDAKAGELLKQLRAERQIRAAAYASYTPSATEAAELTDALMSKMYAPAGRIGPRQIIRWTAGIAAMLAITVTAFTMGRVTAPERKVSVAVPGAEVIKTEYRVVYVDNLGDTQIHSFASMDDVDGFVKELESRGISTNTIAVAELNPAGHM